MNKNKNKGFTLAELLIVVAIIAVLVAISIPIFHAQLRKARLAANQANARAAYAAAMAEYIDQGTPSGNKFYTYNVSTGKLEQSRPVNYGCAVYSYSQDQTPITDISAWKTTSHANANRTLGSEAYKYWQISVIDGKAVCYYALRNLNQGY